jgi:mannose-6-phosphate isomerase-like protein (cupin superfamily)
MPTPYTHTSLADLEDKAPGFGFGDVQEARFANQALETQDTGVSLIRVKPGKRQGFAHRHEAAEEVYVVTSGAGRVKLDDSIVELAALDAVRVAPGVTRQFEAGSEGLELLACGARHEGDGEVVADWWTD